MTAIQSASPKWLGPRQSDTPIYGKITPLFTGFSKNLPRV
jgi:hypothetical protein